MKFSDDYKKARAAFEELDLDGDGFITKEEIATYWKNGVDPEFTSADLENIMMKFDTNEDGKISWDEFKRVEWKADAQKQAKKEEEDMRQIFDGIDIDGDGSITKKEFANFTKTLKDELSSTDIDSVGVLRTRVLCSAFFCVVRREILTFKHKNSVFRICWCSNPSTERQKDPRI